MLHKDTTFVYYHHYTHIDKTKTAHNNEHYPCTDDITLHISKAHCFYAKKRYICK